MKTPLTTVRDRWFHWLLSVELGAYPACQPVAELYRRRLDGDEPSVEEWRKAHASSSSSSASSAAAAYAASSSASSASSAAYAAAHAAAAARSASARAATASTAAADAAAANAYAATRQRIQSELLRLLRVAGYEPAADGLHALVAAGVERCGLDMSVWHCGTTHCRAGWAITVAPLGKQLEEVFGSEFAGAVIYLASTGSVPDFFADNETARADIERCAGES